MGRLMGVNTWQKNEATCDGNAKRGVVGRTDTRFSLLPSLPDARIVANQIFKGD